MKQVTLTIQGMSCGHCVQHLTKLLSALYGVNVEEVKVGEATLEYHPHKIAPDRIIQVIKEAGYEAQLLKEAI
jgi:copper chaperone